MDAAAGFHCVHVGGQHDGRFAGSAVVAGQGGHQVAVGVVLYRRAEVGEPRGEVGVDGVLLAGGAIDPDEFGYGSDETFAIGHGIGLRQSGEGDELVARVGGHFIASGFFLGNGDAVLLHDGPELLGEPGAELGRGVGRGRMLG